MTSEAMMAKQVIGGPVVINGRTLSLSRAVRAGEMVYLTGQVPMRDGAVMTGGSIEDQTRAVLDDIAATLALAGCSLEDVVKSMVWLTSRDDFPGFNAVYADMLGDAKPARTVVPVPELHYGYLVEVDAIASLPATTD